MTFEGVLHYQMLLHDRAQLKKENSITQRCRVVGNTSFGTQRVVTHTPESHLPLLNNIIRTAVSVLFLPPCSMEIEQGTYKLHTLLIHQTLGVTVTNFMGSAICAQPHVC